MTTTHRITTSAVLVLLLAAAAPGALGRPADSGGASAAKPPLTVPAVYSAQDKSLVTPDKSISVPASVTEVSLPHQTERVQTPQAGLVAPPILQRGQVSELEAANRAKEQALVHRMQSKARYSDAELNAYVTTAHPSAVAPPTLTAPGTSFDWGDAAIGAGIAIAVALLIAGSTLAVRQRRQPRHS
jgi:hypothetical protein